VTPFPGVQRLRLPWAGVIAALAACAPSEPSDPAGGDSGSTDPSTETTEDTDSDVTSPVDPDDQDGDGDLAEAAGGRDCNDLDDQVLGDDCAGNWPTPSLTLTLEVDDPAMGLHLPDVQASYPKVDWAALERLYIPAGHYKYIKLGNLPERDPASPLVITNQGGQVRVGGLGHYYILNLEGGTGWVLTGRYDPEAMTGDVDFPGHRGNHYADSGGRYGITIDDGFDNPYTISGLSIGEGASQFEVEFMEITGMGFAGIAMKTDDDGDATMVDCKLHDLYIHDTGSEGMYIGSTQAQPQHRIVGMSIYNNRILRTGTELLQVGQLGPGNEIHHNVFALGALDWKAPFQVWQDNGAQVGVRHGSVAIHHNVFIGAADSLLSFFGQLEVGDDAQPGDLVHVHDNYYSHGRGRGAFLGGNTDLNSEWRFERNTFRSMVYQRDEVYEAVEEDFVFKLGNIVDQTVTFFDNTWEDASKQLHNRGPDGNQTYGTVTGSGNVIDTIAPYPFVDLGLDPAMDFMRVELWTDEATVGRFEPVAYEVGDMAVVDGALYEALSGNTGVFPPDNPAVWSPLPSPKDDVRVLRGSDFAGIGLLDTMP